MEFDDSIQELSLSLIECIPYLDPDKGQAKLLKYIQESIIHKYYALCKKYLSAPELISLDSENSFNIAVSGPDIFMENELSNDLLQYISKLSKEDSKKGQILYLAVFKNLSDKEISQIMNLSRQYINRIKKSLIASFLENYN